MTEGRPLQLGQGISPNLHESEQGDLNPDQLLKTIIPGPANLDLTQLNSELILNQKSLNIDRTTQRVTKPSKEAGRVFW